MSADIDAIYNGELTTYEQRAKLRRERREKQRSASVSAPVFSLVSSRASYMSVTRYKIAFCIATLRSQPSSVHSWQRSVTCGKAGSCDAVIYCA